MNKYRQFVFFVPVVLCVLALFFGIMKYKSDDFSVTEKSSDIVSMGKNWHYTTNISDEPVLVDLPQKLLLDKEVDTLILYNVIPDTPVFEGIFRMGVMFQEVNIYIGGELRAHYGDAGAGLYNYPYVNASNYVKVDLNSEDFGKDVVVELKSGKAFIGELSLVRAPEIGRHSDFVLSSLIASTSNPILSMLCFFIAILVLCVSVNMLVRKQKGLPLLWIAVFGLIWLVFYCSDSVLIWEMFKYDPTYSAINDYKFYIIDSFLPLASLALLCFVYEPKIGKVINTTLFIHALLYVVALILHISGVFSINYFRPFFMVISLVNFILVISRIKDKFITSDYRHFGFGTILLLTGYFFDYIKYVISLLPLSSDIIVFLQLKMPFMFFLGISLVFYSVLCIWGVITLFLNEQRRLKLRAVMDTLTGVYNRSGFYESVDLLLRDGKLDGAYLAIIDIDNFKEINDTYGHTVGDELLRIFGAIISSVNKEEDRGITPVRYGGDEFCMIFTNSNIGEVVSLLFQVQSGFLSETKKILCDTGVTLSIGIAEWENDLDLIKILSKADSALYKSKKMGKNAINIYGNDFAL